MLFVATMTLIGCVPDVIDSGITLNESDLLGKWLLDDTQEYWRFDSGHYGETWDVSDDVQEGEGTKFSWELDGNKLEVVLTGEMGEVVPYDYKVLALTSSSMKLKDSFDNEKTYHRSE